MPEPDLMHPFGVTINLATGEMLEPERTTVRKASDMRGYYADAAALERLIAERGDPVHYEVFEKPVPETPGNLMFCISKLQPGLVGDEFFMTKGHYHQLKETAELYLCLQGRGLMLMKTEAGECLAEPMARGRMVYVPPSWAHRSVNTGDEPLVSFCVYPAQAGHNYGDIEKQGFPKRVVRVKGRAELI
ncbi:MAG: glucose-6-phosphate isomerase family protein [Armatimonadota bacterium]